MLANAGAIPRGGGGETEGGETRGGEAGEELTDASSNSPTVSSDNPTVSAVSFRKIDWKIVRGGLAISRDVIVVATGCTVAIGTILGWVQADSHKNSCAAITASGESDNGKQKYHFKYWVTTSGKNCDTTAQTKTVAAALDDAWDQVHDRGLDWACIQFSHGGTWEGHLAVATYGSGKNVNNMCN